MPIYEFKCPQCGQKEEVVGRITENCPSPPCDKCNVQMERVFSKTAPPIFKGTGWVKRPRD